MRHEATEKLLEQGFIVRSGDALGTPGYIRVTIGTEAQNTGFFKAFDALLEGAGNKMKITFQLLDSD